MLNWKEYRTQLLGRIGEIAKVAPDTIRGYQTLSSAGQKTNHLDPKQRELIALAVAVSLRCDGCITTYVHDALKAGATSPRSRRYFAAVVVADEGQRGRVTVEVLDDERSGIAAPLERAMLAG